VTLVDSNVILDVWSADPEWAEWSTAAIESAAARGPLVVNPVIIAEIATRFGTERDLWRAVAEAGFRRAPLPVAAAWSANRAFGKYRERGGARLTPLADFFIGAHALVEDWSLLTRDPVGYRTYFPGVKLIAPKGR